MKATRIIDGIPVDPVEPEDLDDTPNEERPASHDGWWERPFIRTTTVEGLDTMYADGDVAEEARKDWAEGGRLKWMEYWPSGTRYTVRCLDGGAWDRTTNWGSFATLEGAVACAKSGPAWRR